MIGAEDRAMERAYQKAKEERVKGIRPPIGTRPQRDNVPDPVLDRMLRLIRNRRTQQDRTTTRFHIAPPE